MLIRRVNAHAFGPFADESLELGEGMTVVVGPNESGKSSWHAAIYAGLCGMRRGAGLRREDREFRDRYKPWDGEEWRVACVVDLPDGRTIEVSQALGSGVGSSAREVSRGTDLTSEIINDGAPDGSRWLGLDRRAFLGVASIRQAQILSVTEEAGMLQEHMQRAAATAGTDETAASALNAIDGFLRDNVGSQRANSTRPLMQAIRRLQEAEEVHREAVADHRDWLKREERLAELADEALEARRIADAAEARLARESADRLADRLRKAKKLAERHPSPPSVLRDQERLAEQVATALHGWEHRPESAELDGPTAEELEGRLQALPEPPDGDLDPANEVRSAHRSFRDAHQRYELHQQQKPPDQPDTSSDLSESELVDLARELETPVPAVDEGLLGEVERLRKTQDPSGRGGTRVGGVAAGVAGVVALLIGVSLLATGATATGATGLGVGAILVLLAAVLFRRPTGDSDAGQMLAQAETRLMMAEQLAAAASGRRDAAAKRAEEAGLEPDPAQLRPLADEMRKAENAKSARRSWETQEATLAESLRSAAEMLRNALVERGVSVAEDADVDKFETALARYEDECRLRRDQAAEAKERASLEQSLASRRQAEARAAADVERLWKAEDSLRQAAKAAGVADVREDPVLSGEELATRLKTWQRDLDQRLDEVQEAQNEWARLQTLLDGGTLAELEEESASAERRYADLARDLDERLLREVSLGDDPVLTVRELRREADRLERDSATGRGDLEARAEQVVRVPDAEEQLAAAKEALHRVESLNDVLETTKKFLSQAQERVHRNIAPLLTEKVGDRLSRVTGGRYEEVAVDPRTLKVHVRGLDGHWRDADLLSHGTAEQVYLLLRVAMAEVLTANGVNSPLLLDDSTVQSDPERTRAILDVLHDISSEHQVIVFSQEDDVLHWAQENLGDRDRLLSLDGERH